jgi:hypothetical protein
MANKRNKTRKSNARKKSKKAKPAPQMKAKEPEAQEPDTILQSEVECSSDSLLVISQRIAKKVAQGNLQKAPQENLLKVV